MFKHFFSRQIDSDVLFALQWKKSSRVEVLIKKTEDGYFAKVLSLDGNVVTEAKTGQELFGMVNDAIYEYLDIPTQYREKLGYYIPPEEICEALKVQILNRYLSRVITASA